MSADIVTAWQPPEVELTFDQSPGVSKTEETSISLPANSSPDLPTSEPLPEEGDSREEGAEEEEEAEKEKEIAEKNTGNEDNSPVSKVVVIETVVTAVVQKE